LCVCVLCFVLLLCTWCGMQSLLCDENLSKVPFLVLGNKIDMATAASEEELRFVKLSLFYFHYTSRKNNMLFSAVLLQ
jgi:hypothetical protein